MKDILKIAVGIVEKQRKIAQSIRELQSELRRLDADINNVERFIANNTNLYYCESCSDWKPKDIMRWTDEENRLSGRNKCASCLDEKYFEQLGKAAINQSGLSLYKVPPELLEIEILRAKTRHALKNVNQ